jgi:uncharacterized protein (TIGR03435 family)
MSHRNVDRVSIAKTVPLVVGWTTALEALIAVSLMHAPAICAQSSYANPSTAKAAPKFEVASIKVCKDKPVAGGTGLKGGSRGSGSSSPDRLSLPCSPVRFLIQLAYIITPARLNPTQANLQLEGGPAWIDSDRYQINAKAERPAGKDIMNGPMLQALLEDRFQLKIHREAREVPIYALTVAKGGLKLQPTDGGSCTPVDLTQWSVPLAPGQKPWCGLRRGVMNARQITIDLVRSKESVGNKGGSADDMGSLLFEKGPWPYHALPLKWIANPRLFKHGVRA